MKPITQTELFLKHGMVRRRSRRLVCAVDCSLPPNVLLSLDRYNPNWRKNGWRIVKLRMTEVVPKTREKESQIMTSHCQIAEEKSCCTPLFCPESPRVWRHIGSNPQLKSNCERPKPPDGQIEKKTP